MCGKCTKYMYRLNDGLYCEKHAQVGLLNQKTTLSLEALRDRLRFTSLLTNQQ